MNPALRALLLGLTAALIGFPLMTWGAFLAHHVADGRTDLRATYTAGYMLRTGEPLYDPARQFEEQNRIVSAEQNLAVPFNHPAYEALMYLPLSWLSFVRAYWVWLGVNILLAAVIVWLLREDLAPLAEVHPALIYLWPLAYLPFAVTALQGQDSLVLSVLFVLAYRLRQHPLLAGLILGAGAFRFQYVIPIALCFLCWKRCRMAGGVALGVSLCALLSVALAGFWPYVNFLRDFGAHTGGAQPLVAAMPNLRGLVASFHGSDGLVAILSLAVFALTVAIGRNRDMREQFALAVLCASLVSYHGLFHDQSILVIAFAALLSEAPVFVALAAVIPSLHVFASHHGYLFAFAPLVLWGSCLLSNRVPLITAARSPMPCDGSYSRLR